MNVIEFTPRRLKKRGEDKNFVQRLDAAYACLTQYFMDVLQPEYAKDDIAMLALIKFTADVIRVGRDRPACGAPWAQDMLETFTACVNRPPEK